MKACVISPPIRDFYATRHRLSALGAAAVHEMLMSLEHESVFFNFPAGPGGSTLPLPPELAHLAPYIMADEYGPLSFFTRFRQFGPSLSDCADRVAREAPDMVFISCFAYAYGAEALGLAQEIKASLPETPVCMGGAGATVMPEYFLGSRAVDYVLAGEAETVLPEFLQWIKGGDRGPCTVPGVVSRGVDNDPSRPWRHTEDRHIIPAMRATMSTQDHLHMALSVSRGCLKSCRFCANRLTHGPGFRKAPLEKVLAGIAALPRGKRIFINFEDDNLLHDRDYFLSLLRGIRDLRGDTLFSAENGIDYMLMDRNLALELVSLGFRQFNLSLGSMSGDILRQEEREASLERLREIAMAAQESDVPVHRLFHLRPQG